LVLILGDLQKIVEGLERLRNDQDWYLGDEDLLNKVRWICSAAGNFDVLEPIGEYQHRCAGFGTDISFFC
jgi:hypothetical protein